MKEDTTDKMKQEKAAASDILPNGTPVTMEPVCKDHDYEDHQRLARASDCAGPGNPGAASVTGPYQEKRKPGLRSSQSQTKEAPRRQSAVVGAVPISAFRGLRRSSKNSNDAGVMGSSSSSLMRVNGEESRASVSTTTRLPIPAFRGLRRSSKGEGTLQSRTVSTTTRLPIPAFRGLRRSSKEDGTLHSRTDHLESRELSGALGGRTGIVNSTGRGLRRSAAEREEERSNARTIACLLASNEDNSSSSSHERVGEEEQPYQDNMSLGSLATNVARSEEASVTDSQNENENIAGAEHLAESVGATEASPLASSRAAIDAGNGESHAPFVQSLMISPYDNQNLAQARLVDEEEAYTSNIQAIEVLPEELEYRRTKRKKEKECRRIGYGIILAAVVVILCASEGTCDR